MLGGFLNIKIVSFFLNHIIFSVLRQGVLNYFQLYYQIDLVWHE